MSDDDARRSAIAGKTIVYETPAMAAVTVRADLPYADGEARTLDLYTPPDAKPGERRPAVVFILGFTDPRLGSRGKRMGAYTSWGRLIATSGCVAITYAYEDPTRDVALLMVYLRKNAAALGIDETRIGLWACSGNVPAALGLLMEEGAALRCAFLGYGYMLDDGRGTAVADAAARFGFAPVPAGKTMDDLPPGVPLFLARAGKDEMPGLNGALDRFISAALDRNLPITLINHATGPHAFDLLDDTEPTRGIIRRIVGFFRFHLGIEGG